MRQERKTFMKKTLHRLVASLLVAVLFVSAVRVPVYADEVEEETVVTEEPETPGKKKSKISELVPGYIPAPNEDKYESISEEQAADELFAASERFYISPEAARIPSRDQGSFGSCWAFGTMAAVEMSALRNKVKLSDGSTAGNKINLSELHLAYFVGKSNEPYNPIGGFEGDRNSREDDNFLNGGNPDNAAHLLANWIGAADENRYPYVNDPSLANTEIARENGVDDAVHLKGYYTADPCKAPSAVKNLIHDYGAVAALYWVPDGDDDMGFSFYKDLYSKENNCYYVPKEHLNNHVIAIVGWDDDFPKENFAYSEKPEGDGAWLIRNSWEAGNYVTPNGELTGNEPELNSYFWLSYYDKTLVNICYAFEMESTDRYEHNYQYDGCVITDLISGPVKFANIFTATDEPQLLSAVSFNTHTANLDYKIDVYKGVSEGQPESGTRAMATQEGKTTYSGEYTIELTDPVELEPGESFSVVITVPEGADMAVEMSIDYNFVTTAHTEGNRSLCLDGDVWKTANEYKNTDQYGDFRIKAFTNWSAPVTSVSLQSKMNVKVGKTCAIKPTIKPACAGDKSVTWSSSDESVAYVKYVGKTPTLVAVAKGEADITVTTNDGGFTAVCHVTVTDETDLKLIPGEVRRLNVNEDGTYVSGVQWSVIASPGNCVSVTNGVVTAKNLPKGTSYGKAIVKAAFRDETFTYNITVDGTAHENVPITEGGKKTQITAPKTITLNMGTNGKATISIPAMLKDRAANICYETETEGVCSVVNTTQSGNASKAEFEITPVGAGATYIRWSLTDEKGNETSAYTKVIVKKPVTEIRISKMSTLDVGVGEWLQVKLTGDNTDPKAPVFSVKGKGIKVSKTGHVVATAPGAKGTITVKSGKASSSIDVAASTPEKYMLLKQTSITVTKPKSGVRTARIIIASPKKDQPKVDWSIYSTDLGVTVNENGVVSVSSEAKPGLYEIVATPSDAGSGYNEATCELVVK